MSIMVLKLSPSLDIAAAKGDARALQQCQLDIQVTAADDSNYYSEEDSSSPGVCLTAPPFLSTTAIEEHQLMDIQPSDLMYRGEGNSSLVMALVHVSISLLTS